VSADGQPTPEQEAAALLEGLLDLVYSGELTAEGPAGKALVQHLEGAHIALQVLDEQQADQGVDLRG
jgi:hypothetical protein